MSEIVWRPNVKRFGHERPKWAGLRVSTFWYSDMRGRHQNAIIRTSTHVGDYPYWPAPVSDRERVLGIDVDTGQVWTGRIETDGYGVPLWRSPKQGHPPCAIGMDPEPFGWADVMQLWGFRNAPAVPYYRMDTHYRAWIPSQNTPSREFLNHNFVPPSDWMSADDDDAPL